MKKILISAFAIVGVMGCSTPKPVGWEENHSGTEKFRDPAADTDTDTLALGGQVKLEKCGGKDGVARMINQNGQTMIYAKNLECSKYQDDEMRTSKRMTEDGEKFTLAYEVDTDKPGWHELEIGSKNYFDASSSDRRSHEFKADIIRFYVPPRVVILDLYGSGAETYDYDLKGCKGKIYAKRAKDYSVNIIIKDVTRCNTFDIVRANGEDLDYSNQPIRHLGENSSNSFSIPKKFIEFGANGVELRLYKRGSNQYGDRVLVRFNNWR